MYAILTLMSRKADIIDAPWRSIAARKLPLRDLEAVPALTPPHILPHLPTSSRTRLPASIRGHLPRASETVTSTERPFRSLSGRDDDAHPLNAGSYHMLACSGATASRFRLQGLSAPNARSGSIARRHLSWYSVADFLETAWPKRRPRRSHAPPQAS